MYGDVNVMATNFCDFNARLLPVQSLDLCYTRKKSQNVERLCSTIDNFLCGLKFGFNFVVSMNINPATDLALIWH